MTLGYNKAQQRPQPEEFVPSNQAAQLHVGLFAACLMNVFRPNIGLATVTLLERAGCRVSAPSGQTCCGQPAYSAGDDDAACALARQLIAQFEAYDYVVAPSGSCMGTVPGIPKCSGRPRMGTTGPRALAAKSYELFRLSHRGAQGRDRCQLPGVR